MAIVYGFFRNEEDARRAKQRCEELGIDSTVLNQMYAPPYVDDAQVPHAMKSRERVVFEAGLVATIVIGIIGVIVWFVIPGLWNKLFLAGPLMASLYGAAIGIFIGMVMADRARFKEDAVPAIISEHSDADRVVVCNISDSTGTESVEELLEAEGAVEVIHRAA